MLCTRYIILKYYMFIVKFSSRLLHKTHKTNTTQSTKYANTSTTKFNHHDPRDNFTKEVRFNFFTDGFSKKQNHTET